MSESIKWPEGTYVMAHKSNRPEEFIPVANGGFASLSLDRNDTLTRSGKVQGSLARRTGHLDGAKAAFWKETLQGKTPELGLPADKPKQSQSRASGAQQASQATKEAGNRKHTLQHSLYSPCEAGPDIS